MSIRTEAMTVASLTPNWAQREVLAEVEKATAEKRPCRIITLKARRLGISTVSEALGYIWALRPNTNCAVVAHTEEAASYLFGMARFMHETFMDGRGPQMFPTKLASQRHMEWRGTGSSFRVMTAGNVNAARSMGLGFCHASEVAFWPRPAETMGALMQTIPYLPGTCVILESTAFGYNWWEETWTEAEAGRNDFVPLFFPWWKHPSYIPCQGHTCLDATCDTCKKKTAGVRPKDDEERRLVKLGADLAHIAWRRWAIPNKTFGDESLYAQEYPSTPSDAFQLSGVMAFPEASLQKVYVQKKPLVGRFERTQPGKPPNFIADARGPVRIFKMPERSRWGRYLIGADPSLGGLGGDFSAAQVINRRTKEQVACWQGRINPIAFADHLADLGSFYNDAVIACEVEGGGLGTITRLMDSGYANLWQDRQLGAITGHLSNSLGWQTNYKRKQMMVMKLAEVIERGKVTLHDAATYGELRGYCVPDTAEALTEDGWKGPDDLTPLDRILTWNMRTDTFEWQRPSRVTSYHHEGKLQSFRGFLATEEHRWPIRMSSDRRLVFKFGSELKFNDQIIRVAKNHDWPERSILSPRDAAILGWIVTDGTFRLRKNHAEGVIYQSKKKFFREVQSLLGDEGGKPRTIRSPLGDCEALYVKAVAIKRLRAAGFSGKESLIPIITRLSREAAEAMWDAMMKAEGTTEGRPSGALFCQRPGAVLNAFQTLSLLLGYKMNQGSRDHWISMGTHSRPFSRVGEITLVPYEGRVWCPTVPNSTWVMRQEGRITITGNCYYGANKADLFGPSASGKHDDLVMALGIAIICDSLDPQAEPFEVGEGDRLNLGGPEGIIWGEQVQNDDVEGWA